MSKPTPAPIRILLVDDSELVRRGLQAVLATATVPPLCVVGAVATVADAIATAIRLKPDLVLLDVRLPDGTGFDACRQILARLPATRIIVLTAHSTDSYLQEAAAAGAHGYLLKEVDSPSLLRAIQEVAAGSSILGPDVTARVLRLWRGGNSEPGMDLSTLSGQERRVLALVAEGLTNKQVGEKLGLSENTVKNYLGNVFEKLQIKRRAQAAAIFARRDSTP